MPAIVRVRTTNSGNGRRVRRPYVRQRSRGFTLVELLVVIAIIGILIGLLLPAVQAARESSRRSQCGTNMSQLGKAFLTFVDSNRALPVGSNGNINESWQPFILPYLEEQSLFDQYIFTYEVAQANPAAYANKKGKCTASLDPRTINPKAIRGATIVPELCPSDTPTEKVVGNGESQHNYMACYGNFCLAPTSTMPNVSTLYGGGAFQTVGCSQRPKGLPLKKISDGTSHTIMAGEVLKGINTKKTDYRGDTWYAWISGFTTYLPPNSSSADNGVQDEIDITSTLNPPAAVSNAQTGIYFAARSRHPGGVNVVMCDGAVRYVTDEVYQAVWNAAGSAWGNEVTELP